MEKWKKNQKKSRKSEQDWDVVLIGDDGVQVPCSKRTLQTHSPEFKKMFMNEEQDSVNVQYPGAVIEVIVNYAYAGEVDLDYLLKIGGAVSTHDEVRSLVQVLCFSNNFEMPDVTKFMETKIGELVFQKKEFRFVGVILSELWNQGEDEGPFWDLSFQIVSRKPEDYLFSDGGDESSEGAISFHPRLLVDLLAQIDDPIVAVKCLQKYEQTICQGDEISIKIVNAAKNVDLKQIAYPELAKLFQDGASSLFPMERLVADLLHVGNNNPKAGTEQAADSTFKSGLICVAGSGKEDVDGYYKQIGDLSYVKIRSNGGKLIPTCHLDLHWIPDQSKWAMSFKDRRSGSITHSHWYKASIESSPKLTEDVDIRLPFNSWELYFPGTPSSIIVTVIEEPNSWPEFVQMQSQGEWKRSGAAARTAYAPAPNNSNWPLGGHQAKVGTSESFQFRFGNSTGPCVYGQ